jgi:hypothetical protein
VHQGGTSTALAAAALAAAVFAPEIARGDVFLSPPDTTVDARMHQIVLAQIGYRETLHEQIEIISTASSFVWLRAVPNLVELGPSDQALFKNLDEMTDVQEPHNESMRPVLFGPSVVTVLTRKLIDRPRARREAESDDLHTLEIAQFASYSGPVFTSTITRRSTLPGGLVEMAMAHGREIDAELESRIASYRNRGWTIFAAVVRDTAPSADRPGRLGPFKMQIETAQPIYPRGLGRVLTATRFRFWIIAPEVYVPIPFESAWEDRPWAAPEIPAGRFVISYNQPIDPLGTMYFELRQRANLDIGEGDDLVRADLRLASGPINDIELSPARDAVRLPPPGERGSSTDVLFCVLLGLTPLLYTPESWFLLWLAARAKARARREGRAFGTRLWSVYAVVVGIFWFLVLEDSARVAAILPMLIGVVQLALPYAERDPSPVRVRFQKKKKEKS